MSFNFGYWSSLAASDPERFEEERSKAIEAEIALAPTHRQPGLWKLQGMIDQLRSEVDNPLDAAAQMLILATYAEDQTRALLLEVGDMLCDVHTLQMLAVKHASVAPRLN